tara:strand:- start:10370 stop:10738 length:369 start_codon:yes stop_codon:yes gene_type:complete
MNKMKLWKPLFIENSKIPVWLSYIAPIDIGAITLGPIVISRDEMSEITKRHETIHYQQYIELAFIGFPILYLVFWLNNLLKGQDGDTAYYSIPFEAEAYANDEDENYLENRKRYSWIYYTSS